MSDQSRVCIPIPTEVFAGLIDFLREEGSDRDPVKAVEDAIDYWIDNASWKQEDLLPEIFQVPPRHQRGYIWKEVFLPHGTRLRMRYKRQDHYAKVEGDEILYQGEPVSPSEFAFRVTKTSRNAWRDIWIKRPDDSKWYLADDLRSQSVRDSASNPSGSKSNNGKHGYRDDLVDILLGFQDGKAHRSRVIDEVYKRRKSRGDRLPDTFEQTVQKTFEIHCGESDNFCGKPELDLFRFPEGKRSGMWGLNRDAAERYRQSRDA